MLNRTCFVVDGGEHLDNTLNGANMEGVSVVFCEREGHGYRSTGTCVVRTWQNARVRPD